MPPYTRLQATTASTRELQQRVRALTAAHHAERAARTAAEQRARNAATETARAQAALHRAQQRARQATTGQDTTALAAERDELRERLRVAEQRAAEYAGRYDRAVARVSRLQAALEDEQKVQAGLRGRIRAGETERDTREQHHLRTLADLYQARLAATR